MCEALKRPKKKKKKNRILAEMYLEHRKMNYLGSTKRKEESKEQNFIECLSSMGWKKSLL